MVLVSPPVKICDFFFSVLDASAPCWSHVGEAGKKKKTPPDTGIRLVVRVGHRRCNLGNSTSFKERNMLFVYKFWALSYVTNSMLDRYVDNMNDRVQLLKLSPNLHRSSFVFLKKSESIIMEHSQKRFRLSFSLLRWHFNTIFHFLFYTTIGNSSGFLAI